MQSRVVILDTETTGLSSKEDRIIDIGCVELIHGEPTGETFQTYINPEKEVSPGAFKVHGLHWDFLKKYPTFSEIAKDFLAFIQNSTLVIHNAPFDVGFLNAELKRAQYEHLANPILDTLALAKKKFPGAASKSLDALCRHFRIDLTKRSLHGALLDAELLSHVYREMTGGFQENLKFVASKEFQKKIFSSNVRKSPRTFHLSPEETREYKNFLEKLRTISGKK